MKKQKKSKAVSSTEKGQQMPGVRMTFQEAKRHVFQVYGDVVRKLAK